MKSVDTNKSKEKQEIKNNNAIKIIIIIIIIIIITIVVLKCINLYTRIKNYNNDSLGFFGNCKTEPC